MAKTEISRASTAHIPPFGLRLQADLKDRLEKAAREGGRSMNAEITSRLAASFEGEEVETLKQDIARLTQAVDRREYAMKLQEFTVETLARYVIGLHGEMPAKARENRAWGIPLRLAESLLAKDGAGLADVFSDLFADDQIVVAEMALLKNEFLAGSMGDAQVKAPADAPTPAKKTAGRRKKAP